VKAFVRTFLTGLGLLFLLVVSAGITVLISLKSSGDLQKSLRGYVLSEDERRELEVLQQRADEPPALRYDDREHMDETLQRIADMANEAAVRELVENLSARERALSERADLLAQQEADLRLARTDIERMRRQLEEQRVQVQAMLEEVEARSAQWAAAKAREAQRLQAFSEVEQARLQEAAVMYESSRQPWELLKTLEDAERIARILLFMQPKKASKVLDSAVRDPAYRDMPRQIHEAMMTIDKDGITGDQAARLADLYSLMRPAQVLPYLAESSDEEVVEIMTRFPDPKRRAALLEALIEGNPERGARIQTMLEQGTGGAQ